MLSLVAEPDLVALAAALKAADLPVEDIDQPGRRFFRAVDKAGGTIGYGGLEGYGAEQLLRSVVIEDAQRGKGWGRVLIAALAAQARAEGAGRLWLMTVDAADFFRHLGFAAAAREAAPAIVTQSLQFTTLCPANAKVMVKVL
jgi:N-acetylglutamate synthase-like GNAT family acetyltransferase